MSTRPVRSIDTYCEVDGPFAVARDRADHIHEAAFRLVGQHTGRIAAALSRGVRIASDASAVVPEYIRVPQSDHISIVTGRRVLRPDGRRIIGKTVMSKTTHCTRTMLCVEDKSFGETDAADIRRMAHETAHGFGLIHCKIGSCAMAKSPPIDPTELVVPGDIFCNSCASDLELAGYVALATTL